MDPDEFRDRPPVMTQAEINQVVQDSFNTLNQMRQNPAAFSEAAHVDLSRVAPMPPLIWNAQLAQSATARAVDMAQKDYCDHTDLNGVGPNAYARQAGYPLPDDWSGTLAANHIESLTCGPSLNGRVIMLKLIYDDGMEHQEAGHRQHLLGMNIFSRTHIHAGIGFAYNPKSRWSGFYVIHTAHPRRR